MRRRMLLVAAALLFAAPGLLHAGSWEFDPDHTGVHFKVRHLMVSSVRGEFEKVTGEGCSTPRTRFRVALPGGLRERTGRTNSASPAFLRA